MNLRNKIKNNDTFVFRVLRSVYFSLRRFSIPAPKIIALPLWKIVDWLRETFYWILSTFWITPLFKGLCKKVGKGFKAGTFLPYVVGKGHLYIGDRVRIYGKINFYFGGIKKEVPEIHIGARSTIGHNISFDISGRLDIGEHCLIASETVFQDCSGHSIDADERSAGKKPEPRDVKPIKIGNNVWIGKGAYILPGTTIEDNCVIAAKAVVGRRIPENHLVSPATSKVIKLRKISAMK